MKEKIIFFWTWFSNISDLLASNYDDENLINDINSNVATLGEFSWEIGAGKVKNNAFTISPNGDIDLLNETKHIIALAPVINNWEFHYSKQPKDWDLLFELEINHNIETIDASKWRYILFKYPDNTFDILIESSKLFELDEDSRIYATEIALDGVIGEELRITTVGNIEIVSKAYEYKSKLNEFINLNKHLRFLIGEA